MKSTFKRIFVLAAVAALAAADAAAQGTPTPNLPRPGGNNANRRNAARNGGNAFRSAANPAQPAGEGKSVEPGGRSIEFNQAPVEMVFKVYGELKNVTVLKDPQTPSATITCSRCRARSCPTRTRSRRSRRCWR